MRIIHPNGNGSQALHASQVTKGQLVKVVNQQSTHIRRLEVEQRKVVDLMLAITQNPEAFKVTASGHATIERAAVLAVLDNTALHVRRNGDVYELTHTAPQEQGAIHVPKLIVTPGAD